MTSAKSGAAVSTPRFSNRELLRRALLRPAASLASGGRALGFSMNLQAAAKHLVQEIQQMAALPMYVSGGTGLSLSVTLTAMAGLLVQEVDCCACAFGQSLQTSASLAAESKALGAA